MQTTLVIHPQDATTDFLQAAYADTGYTVIREACSKAALKRSIQAHDRIIMLGHGDEHGLLGHNRRFIGPDMVYLLRQKECVSIWCFARDFVRKYGYGGICTGMIVSEMQEAEAYDIACTQQEVNQSNTLFAATLRDLLMSGNMGTFKHDYQQPDNPVVTYNRAQVIDWRKPMIQVVRYFLEDAREWATIRYQRIDGNVTILNVSVHQKEIAISDSDAARFKVLHGGRVAPI